MSCFAFGFGEGFDAVLRKLNFLAFQKLGNRQNLEGRASVPLASAFHYLAFLLAQEVRGVPAATVEAVIAVVTREPIDFFKRFP